MNTHTPGPWSIQFSSGNNGRSEYVHRLQFGLTLIQNLLGTTESTIHANAHLIAAAPALLEPLENLQNDDNSIPSHAWDMVQSAIAKAKGETK